MKSLLVVLLASLLWCSAAVAQKEVPIPRPGPQPRPPVEEVQPAPAPQPQPPQQPIVVQPPQVTVEAPRSEFFNWVMTSIMGLIAAIFGIRTMGDFRKPKIGALLDNPEVRARIDERVLQLIETGIPGRLVSQIPGVGLAEPLIRRVVSELIERRIADLRSGGGGGAVVPMVDSERQYPQPDFSEMLALLRKVAKRIDDAA